MSNIFIHNHSNRNYVALSIIHLRDTSLSWQAMGMLSFMLSCNQDFKLSVEGLGKCSACGDTATRSALKELREKGYVVVSPIKEGGRIVSWNYDVYESPPDVRKPQVDLPDVEIQHVENAGQSNNIIKDINVQSKDCTTLFDNKPNIIKEENISSIPPIIPHEEKRKGANLDTSFVEDEYKDAYMQWLEYKRAIKKPYKTQQSLELNYRQAKSLAGNDPQTFRLIIEQSIGNGWTGLFELKTNYHESTTVNSPSNGLNEPERRKRNYDFAF